MIRLPVGFASGGFRAIFDAMLAFLVSHIEKLRRPNKGIVELRLFRFPKIPSNFLVNNLALL